MNLFSSFHFYENEKTMQGKKKETNKQTEKKDGWHVSLDSPHFLGELAAVGMTKILTGAGFCWVLDSFVGSLIQMGEIFEAK